LPTRLALAAIRTVPPLARSRSPAEAWRRPQQEGKNRGELAALRGARLGRFRIAVSEDLLDHHRILDAGDDAHRPAAHRAGLDVDVGSVHAALLGLVVTCQVGLQGITVGYRDGFKR
jgi:hypothetical protein